MNIRQTIFQFILRRQAKRQVVMRPWDKVRTVAILYDCGTPAAIERMLETEHKRIDFFTLPDKKEINWLTHSPSSSVQYHLRAYQYDLLIDLTQQSSLTMQYMAMYFRADFKVGRQICDGIHDLTIHTPAQSTPDYLLEQILRYIQMFTKKTNKTMKGLGTALITPFCDNGSIDYSALAHLIEHQVAGGVDYLVILGTTSEAPTLSIEEQEQVIAFVVKQVAGRVPLVLGVGGNDTAALVARIQTLSPILQQHFAAILSVTPYYNRPPQEGLYQHFCAVATASPIPILLYNVPKRTGVNLLPETTRRIYDAHPDKIMGIKEACNSVEQFTETVKIANGDFAVISGDDDLAYEMMRAGGDGLISVASNAWPAAMRQLIHEQSALIQQQYAHLIHLLFVEGNPGGIKTVLSEMGIIKNVLRLPLVANTPNHQMVIRKALEYHTATI